MYCIIGKVYLQSCCTKLLGMQGDTDTPDVHWIVQWQVGWDCLYPIKRVICWMSNLTGLHSEQPPLSRPMRSMGEFASLSLQAVHYYLPMTS